MGAILARRRGLGPLEPLLVLEHRDRHDRPVAGVDRRIKDGADLLWDAVGELPVNPVGHGVDRASSSSVVANYCVQLLLLLSLQITNR